MSRDLATWIQSAYDLETRLADSGGELTPEIEQWMQAINLNLPAAVDNTKLLMDRLETLSAEYRARAQAVTKVARGLDKTHDRIKENIKALAAVCEQPEFLGDKYRLLVTASKSKLVIEDENLIPEEYKIPEVLLKPDLGTIRQALEAGQEIPGAKLVASSSLRSYMNRK